MPWTPESFRQKHNQDLSDSQADKAARVANAILKDTGDEGKAIRVANSIAKKHSPYKSHRNRS